MAGHGTNPHWSSGSGTPPPPATGSGSGYEADKWRRAQYQSWMTPAQYREYQRLNADYRSAYGSNFGDFDYWDYTNDSESRRNVDYFASTARGSSKQGRTNMTSRDQSLTALKNFFAGIDEDIKIPEYGPDGSGYGPRFDKAGVAVDAQAAQQQHRAAGELTRGFQGAADRVTEQLAGTGALRSGFAAKQYIGVETQRATKQANAAGQIESSRVGAQTKLDFDRMQFGLNQLLVGQGQEIKMINDTLAMQREMEIMNYGALLEYEDGSWLETYGDFIEIGASVVKMFV